MKPRKFCQIWRRSWPPKRQKNTQKNALSATFWTHMKQSWENPLLRGQMTSKSENSKLSKKFTRRAFERGILGLIWMSGRPPKVALNWHYASGNFLSILPKTQNFAQFLQWLTFLLFLVNVCMVNDVFDVSMDENHLVGYIHKVPSGFEL